MKIYPLICIFILFEDWSDLFPCPKDRIQLEIKWRSVKYEHLQCTLVQGINRFLVFDLYTNIYIFIYKSIEIKTSPFKTVKQPSKIILNNFYGIWLDK